MRSHTPNEAPKATGEIGRLNVDLHAVAANWKALAQRAGDHAGCAAVVKADAYGLGVEPVSRCLYQAGCNTFFVALPDEGVRLRAALGRSDGAGNVQIYVLGGYFPGAAQSYIVHTLAPVLGSLDEARAWRTLVETHANAPAAALHVDTGMNRLGLDFRAFDEWVQSPTMEHLNLALVLSHLACAETPEHPLNTVQLQRFRQIRQKLPHVPASLANSSGIFLGPDYHFDLLRPGYSLYGGNPTPGAVNPMQPVVSLEAPVLDVRTLRPGDTVSYGAHFRATRNSRIAVVGAGYADGVLRSAGQPDGSRYALVCGQKAPIVGRVTMDMIMLDITDIPAIDLLPRQGETLWVQLIGDQITIDDAAEGAGTIGYEVLTCLGARYMRTYTGGKNSNGQKHGQKHGQK